MQSKKQRRPSTATRIISAYIHPPRFPLAPQVESLPTVFRGLWCPCPEIHHQEAGYYVSVCDGSPERTILALGPFQEHHQALARVDDVRQHVLDHYNPEGRAHWYWWGTQAMNSSYREPGKLNSELGLQENVP